MALMRSALLGKVLCSRVRMLGHTATAHGKAAQLLQSLPTGGSVSVVANR
jgi:hypothetical protein